MIAFWACFWLLLAGLRSAKLPVSGAGPLIAGVVLTLVMLLITAGLLKTEKASPDDVGLGHRPKMLVEFAQGLGLGLALVAAMIGLLVLATPLQIATSSNDNVLGVLAASFIVMSALGLMEEVAFRTYPLFRLRQAWGIRPAVYVTSVAFAFYHGLAVENLLGPGVWGLFFAWMALATNSIALPTGFHIGLNWLQALLGMKPRYSDSIWELSIGTSAGRPDVDTAGMMLQLALLAVGVILIEKQVRKEKSRRGH